MTENTMRSDVDGYGFQRPSDFNHEKYEEFMAQYLRIMTRRAMRWNSLIGGKDRVTKSGTVKRFCRKGVPAAQRTMVWMSLSGAQSRLDTNPHLYTQMLSASHNQTLVETITMDIHRTFPDNLYFATDGDSNSLRKPLYNVLVAIGHKNKELGYCQGMNFTAGLLLLVIKSEEKVFWLMDTLINSILPDYYSPDMQAVKIDQEVLGELVKSFGKLGLDPINHSNYPKGFENSEILELGRKYREKWSSRREAGKFHEIPGEISSRREISHVCQEVLGELVKWKAPGLAVHLEQLGLSWCLIGMKWFICLFADVMPVDTVLRIWDCLFNEGAKILMRASLVLVLNNQEKIMACKTFSEVADLFKNVVCSPTTLHCHTFLQSMFKDVGSLPMTRIQKLRQECTGRV